MRSLPLSFVVLGTVAFAQADMRARLAPITVPLRRAGVYHVATGAWTRGASLENAVGPSTIYDNTCATRYLTTMIFPMRFQHRSRLPSASGPTTDSVFYGTTDSNHRYDERPGCAVAYLVNGFEVSYCSSHVGTIDWSYGFASSYAACGAGDIVPQYTFAMTGLPGGTSSGGQGCWVVDFDLSGEPGGGIVLSADGDGTYDGPSTADQFGWSFAPASATSSDFTGPVLAGDFTWTGGTLTGPLTPCTGTDGTIWDRPVVATDEPGTGMSSSDFFRCTPCQVGPSSPGCYYFGGNPHADFYLKLFASTTCPPDDPMVAFCAGGVAGIVTCPCGNPQVPAGATKGCDNFVGGGTGGAVLAATGTPSIATDSLILSASSEAPAVTITVLFQGTTGSANTRTGAGVRCVAGNLTRLYKGNAVGGSIQFPNDAVSIHDRSAAKGFPIVPPVTLDYYCAYRNAAANGQPGCPGLNLGFNATNAGAVGWLP